MNEFTQLEFYGAKFVISSVNAPMRSSTTLLLYMQFICVHKHQCSTNDIQTFGRCVQRNGIHEPVKGNTMNDSCALCTGMIGVTEPNKFIRIHIIHPFTMVAT